MQRLRTLPLAIRMIVLLVLAVALAVAGTVLLSRWLPTAVAGVLAGAASAALAGFWVWRSLAPVQALFRALAGTVAAYRDGDFSFGIHWDRHADLAELVQAHNALGNTLREQRLDLVQRELLLDTVVQNTPVAMLLLDPTQHVVLANLAARRLFNAGRKLEGHALADLLASVPAAVREALGRAGDGMFTAGEAEDVYHLSRRSFRLNGRPHELLLLRQMTVELRRREVQTWKNVIRVISHELNNSLGPISSLAHSGTELLRRGQVDRLPLVLDTIGERARHLDGFLREYARFAKLPSPQLEAVRLPPFIEKLQAQVAFAIDGTIPDATAQFDPAQIQQALLNLLKNAHESGGAPDQVALSLRQLPGAWELEVRDRGTGMGEAALANALLPFYSTKRNGTGLGLALAREIAEAHGGRIAIANRPDGGVRVVLSLPRGPMSA